MLPTHVISQSISELPRGDIIEQEISIPRVERGTQFTCLEREVSLGKNLRRIPAYTSLDRVCEVEPAGKGAQLIRGARPREKFHGPTGGTTGATLPLQKHLICLRWYLVHHMERSYTFSRCSLRLEMCCGRFAEEDGRCTGRPRRRYVSHAS